MRIKEMFEDDINRNINGVVKVDEKTDATISQEVKEYVITKELKKHFVTFFNAYSESFDHPTTDIGVWISGFFGSGKSHFLKMLSYILQNKEIDGRPTVDYFKDKFEDDELTFDLIEKSTETKAETILFNIDVESVTSKEDAVIRVFAKMFYNHLGFYGENLKVARLERFIDKKGKTEEFRRVFEEKNGESWLESRDSFDFYEDEVEETLQEVLGMSEKAAENWFNGEETDQISIDRLVEDIREYVDTKPDDFRLLFMADEVGQYVGTDNHKLLNLQSIVEELGSRCQGKVWVVCTGQEAIDQIIKVRNDEFSKIQARFSIRLSLSSSSVDEVIQKRILRKNEAAKKTLSVVFANSEPVMKNLFTFTGSTLDIKGFRGKREFIQDFPFVPYQFTLMQNVFAQIRKHGNAGKHLSGGERSMLSGFQEVAQKLEDRDERTLAPFQMFYDTVQTFLDSSIRQVINRAQKAADNHEGLEQCDVDVLKLLYLIRYIEDVPSNVDNIVILMADNINLDKVDAKKKIVESLDRLLRQNKIGRTGDTYNFLTDEEQDIQREINNINVDNTEIVREISQRIFGDIYPSSKYRYGKNDYPFDRWVDDLSVGQVQNGMSLRILTVATDETDKSELQLTAKSADKDSYVVLADTKYYDLLLQALKIHKYVKQRNVSQLPQTQQTIIRGQQEQASRYEREATDALQEAIVNGVFYAAGERIQVQGSDANSKLDHVLDYLVSTVYNKLELVHKHYDDKFAEANLKDLFQGKGERAAAFEYEENYDAAKEVDDYLERQRRQNLRVTMNDLQKRFTTIPYGWSLNDILAVLGLLTGYQKITIKNSGNTIRSNDPKILDFLSLRSEVGKTEICKRISVNPSTIKEVLDFLRDYFDEMDIPNDEDGLADYIVKAFGKQQDHYKDLLNKYNGHHYPDKNAVLGTVHLLSEILSQQKDNTALFTKIIDKEDELYDSRELLSKVEDFFTNQVSLFNSADHLVKSLEPDKNALEGISDAHEDLKQIQRILDVDVPRYDYRQIPKLNDLMSDLEEIHDKLLAEKRNELNAIIQDCRGEIHSKMEDSREHDVAKEISDQADRKYEKIKEDIRNTRVLAYFALFENQIIENKDFAVKQLDQLNKPKPVVDPSPKPSAVTPKPRTVKSIDRRLVFNQTVIKNKEDISSYLQQVKEKLEQLLEDSDEVDIK